MTDGVSMNNPAGRLYRFLSQAKGNIKDRGLQGWAKTLHIDLQHRDRLLTAIGMVWRLPGQVDSDLRQIDDLKHDLYLSWVEPMETCLAHLSFEGGFGSFLSAATPDALNLIAICDGLLAKGKPEVNIDESELEALQEQIRKLIEEIQASDLDPSAREYMIGVLIGLDSSLLYYRIDGTQSLYEATTRIVGDFVIKQDTIKQTRASPEGERFWDVCRKIALIGIVFQTGQQLLTATVGIPEHVKGLLGFDESKSGGIVEVQEAPAEVAVDSDAESQDTGE